MDNFFFFNGLKSNGLENLTDQWLTEVTYGLFKVTMPNYAIFYNIFYLWLLFSATLFTIPHFFSATHFTFADYLE